MTTESNDKDKPDIEQTKQEYEEQLADLVPELRKEVKFRDLLADLLKAMRDEQKEQDHERDENPNPDQDDG